jgi:multicomponent Na+:H+ antiporter subunit F
MDVFYIAVATFLLLNIVLGLIRLMRGPTDADRMISVQLFGSSGVAALLLIGQASGEEAYLNVALLFALLAAVATVAFATRAWGADA